MKIKSKNRNVTDTSSRTLKATEFDWTGWLRFVLGNS